MSEPFNDPSERPDTDLTREEFESAMNGQGDERRGLPSASSMQRILECAGSLPLTERLRVMGRLPADHGSEDADRGTRIHAILDCLSDNREPAAFDPEEMAEARELWEQAQEIITRTFGTDLSDVEIKIEERRWMLDPFTEEPIASGRYDITAVSEARRQGLVLDYKTGHGNVPRSESNWQLRMGAVQLMEAHTISSVIVGVVQSGCQVHTATFNSTDLQRFQSQIIEAIGRKFMDPFKLGFDPSEDRCKYCPARLACPRLHYDLSTIHSESDPLLLIATASTPRLSDFLLSLESVEVIAKAAKTEMTARLKAGEEDANWHMASGPARRKITNAAAMGKALIAEGATVETVLAAISLNVGAAEAVLKDATKLKGKALAARMVEIGADYIVASEPEPSLKRR